MTTEFETDMYDLNIESDAVTGTYSATKYNRYTLIICEPIICIEPQQKGDHMITQLRSHDICSQVSNCFSEVGQESQIKQLTFFSHMNCIVCRITTLLSTLFNNLSYL